MSIYNEPDWKSTNESDGLVFYGYDDDDGKTYWYDKDGVYDCTTETPDLDDLTTERKIYDGYLEDLSGHE